MADGVSIPMKTVFRLRFPGVQPQTVARVEAMVSMSEYEILDLIINSNS